MYNSKIKLLFGLCHLFYFSRANQFFVFYLDCSRISLTLRENCECYERSASIICESAELLDISSALVPIGTEKLVISGANLSNLTDTLLPSTLTDLSVWNCNLSHLTKSPPISIRFIDFYNNSLTSVRNVVKLPNLERLNVRFNSLTSLSSAVTPALTHLDVGDNQLFYIPDLIESNIRSIMAQRNRISFIDRLPVSLQELIVPWNNITSFSFFYDQVDKNGGEKRLQNLQSLDLYSNERLDFCSESLILLEKKYINPSLSQLYLGKTATMEFPTWICSIFPNIAKLSFYEGKINGIRMKHVTTICNKTTVIELHGNPLSAGIDARFVAKLFPNLRHLTLSGSASLHCDCQLFRWIKLRDVKVDFANFSAICASPAEWRDFRLHSSKPPVDCGRGNIAQDEPGIYRNLPGKRPPLG